MNHSPNLNSSPVWHQITRVIFMICLCNLNVLSSYHIINNIYPQINMYMYVFMLNRMPAQWVNELCNFLPKTKPQTLFDPGWGCLVSVVSSHPSLNIQQHKITNHDFVAYFFFKFKFVQICDFSCCKTNILIPLF